MEARLHDAFRSRPELKELTLYSRETLISAFLKSPRLSEILTQARELEPGVAANGSSERGKQNTRGSRTRDTVVLPLPGDPAGTSRPGQKPESYRDGFEADLRQLAQKQKWR